MAIHNAGQGLRIVGAPGGKRRIIYVGMFLYFENDGEYTRARHICRREGGKITI